ncbi:DEAD/DEAH box helicase family protein [Romboutsia timonensis]|uniref:restriction endonuclease n=1 Tax=Romboutsia timonensis TaxID=1776391 RepID=UPI002A8354E5|nr:DEAD/DEAH box helicase family protein [Romboutsia timonensis]MDY3959835.1 DEAD/DEAH box helicase family protein [Romboutsia timonensis]
MSEKIQFHFDSKQPHQIKAIDAVKELFKGQNKITSERVIVSQNEGLVSIDEGHANRLSQSLTETKLIENLHKIQLNNLGYKDKEFHNKNYTIEMETGTGKTYVYIRTILELYKEYGFAKFIIVVPTIPIRKGVEKSVNMLADHFKTLYNGLDIRQHFFSYDSKKLTDLDKFVQLDRLQVVIMNIQQFNSSKTKIKKDDHESGKVYWDMLSNIKPIVIIDEPQRLEGNGKKKSKALESIEELKPLFTLRYSATHKNLYNLVYKLDSFDAYEQDLVKKIEVSTVYSDIDTNYPYVRFARFNSDYSATLEILKSSEKGTHLEHVRVNKNDNLHELSDGLPQYKDMFITKDPHKVEGIDISNLGTIKLGEDNYNINQKELARIQIRITIRKHLDKQLELINKNIKVLSLFFIDEVKKFRDYSKEDTRGIYAMIFDEEYSKLIKQSKYKPLLEKMPELNNISSVREGYFAIDKNKKAIEIDNWDYNDDTASVRKTPEEVERGIELILDKKDELISFKEPLSFIFAHSALREGWDNPNIFQLCMLRNTNSEISKKQEIGRGLRLAVNTNGERETDKDVNILTVIANEHYDKFAESLQREYNEDAGYNREVFNIQDAVQIQSKIEKLIKEKLSDDFADKLINEMVKGKFLNKKDNKLTEKIKDINLYEFKDKELNKYQSLIQETFKKYMQGKESKKIQIINGDMKKENEFSSYIKEPEFNKLLTSLIENISQRAMYEVNINKDDFITECINRLNLTIHKKSKQLIEANANLEINKQKGAKMNNETKYTHEVSEEISVSKSYIEIVDYLMKYTLLPRMVIFKILDNVNEINLLQDQSYLDEALDIMLEVLKAHKVSKINYVPIDNHIYEMGDILQRDTVDMSKIGDSNKKIYEAIEKNKRSVYKYIVTDSKGEYEFAKHLDQDEDVLLFTKLKKGKFTIDTPFGNYTPDWGIVYRLDEDEAGIYFIVETKWDKEEADLTDVEKGKIHCAERYFETINENVESEVAFSWVNSWNKFTKEIKKKRDSVSLA